jgi:hypothetical protein
VCAILGLLNLLKIFPLIGCPPYIILLHYVCVVQVGNEVFTFQELSHSLLSLFLFNLQLTKMLIC